MSISVGGQQHHVARVCTVATENSCAIIEQTDKTGMLYRSVQGLLVAWLKINYH